MEISEPNSEKKTDQPERRVTTYIYEDNCFIKQQTFIVPICKNFYKTPFQNCRAK